MGTRLYPITDNVSIIERLAGVAPGTEALLSQLEKTWKETRSDAWDSDTLYDLLDQNPEANRLYDFHLFGWGKLNSSQWELIKTMITSDDDLYGGSTSDPIMMEKLIELATYKCGDINIEGLSGVRWS